MQDEHKAEEHKKHIVAGCPTLALSGYNKQQHAAAVAAAAVVVFVFFMFFVDAFVYED
jgi:hypothetical protein